MRTARLGQKERKFAMDHTNIETRHRTLLILWLATFMSTVVFLVFVLFMPSGANPPQPTLGIILNCVGILPVAISFPLKQQVLAQSTAEQRIDRVQVAYVLAFALCEASALLAVVAHFVAGLDFYYLGFVFAGVGQLCHFPQKRHLLAASGQEF